MLAFPERACCADLPGRVGDLSGVRPPCRPGELLFRFGERLLAFLYPWTSPGELLCRLGETLVFWTFWHPAPFVLLLPLDDKLILGDRPLLRVTSSLPLFLRSFKQRKRRLLESRHALEVPQSI